MTPIQEIFKLALKQHPLSIALVTAGLKPSAYGEIKVSKELIKQIDEDFKYHKITGYPEVGFYVFPRWLSMQDKSDKMLQFMIFNDQSLTELLPILNDHQSSFKFTNGPEIRLTNIGFYQLARTKKNWSPLMKQDVTVVCGLCFGFPVQSSVKFGLEVFLGEMEPNRIGYEVKGESNLVFIGYPETKAEDQRTIKKWSDFKKTKEYQEIIKNLNLAKV